VGETIVTTAAMTSYVILTQQTESADLVGVKRQWHEIATVQALSADSAIRKANKEGVLIAVPARSWNPVRVTTETKTVLKLGLTEPSTPTTEAPR